MCMVSYVFGSSEWLVSIVDMASNIEFCYTKPVSPHIGNHTDLIHQVPRADIRNGHV